MIYRFIVNIFLVTLLLSKTSCKKNDEAPELTSSQRLSYMDLRWNNQGGGIPTNDRMLFKYDASGRVTELYAHNTLTGPTAPYDSIFNFYFEYIGNNTLPHRFIYYFHLSGSYEIHYLKYDNYSRPISDSVFISSYPLNSNQANFVRRVDFSYNGDIITCRDSAAFGNGYAFYTLTHQNGNYIKRQPIPSNISHDYYYEYDNHSNPLNELNVSPIFPFANSFNRPDLGYWSSWTFCSKNNMTKIKTDYYSSINQFNDSTTLMNYYNSNNQLEKRILLNRYNWAQDTIYFHYE